MYRTRESEFMSDVVTRLRGAELFEHLTDEQLGLLAEHSREQRFGKNVLLMQEGEQGDTMYVVSSGEFKVFVSDDNGRELVLHQLGPGAVMGDLALLDGEPRSASVMALEESSVLVIGRAGLLECLAHSPEFALNIIRSLTQRLRVATEGSRSLALDNVYRRLADKLRELAGIEDESLAWADESALPMLERKYSHQELGNLIGASREMVGKVMAELVKGEYVEVVQGRIKLKRKLPRNW
jgi:CRP/FNR family cyclic AMP-dependent transcriptional regulator